MPSRAVTSFLLRRNKPIKKGKGNCVNALTGCYLISTSKLDSVEVKIFLGVSMPSRAVTSFLHYPRLFAPFKTTVCQCPHGLLPHFYVVPFKIFRLETSPVSMPSRAVTSFLQTIFIVV